ncbi:MAG: hypothetical protein KA717_34310 [Woronichinia naegeliana WA131]|uniref:Uncharacterized protein n=1 Tax=Woronichinia naegeliana WA131 TaxID=2824559 RepID=A0A977KV82_9CYAN|nr:MAG: hypothetical protein KA717_34310 [Woronichinia naegeliana WA131]
MYRKQQYSIETPENLKNLFGGQLDEENRWIEMSKMILWEEYEEEYAKRHWYRLARSYKRCNTRGSTNQANLE